MAADEQVSGRVPSRPHSMSADDRFDAVVIGAGPGGRGVARRLAKAGRRVAVVEDELVGGECPFWACIPSKALLRPAEARGEAVHVAGLGRPPLDWAEVARYRDYMVSGHDDTKKTKSLTDAGIEVVRGRGRVDGPGRVSAGEHALQAEHVVIATGTTSAIPPIEGLDGVAYWTNREATAMETVPASAVVLGGGPVGVELGQMLARFGARTTIVEALPRLLARETPEVGDRLGELLRGEGIGVRLGAKAVRVDANRVHLDDGSGVEGERLVVAVGRKPRTDDLGLETVGIEPTDGGTLAVDAHCRAGDGVWAVGDVTGVAQFTHVAAYQAGVAVADMLGTPREADYRAVPRVVFTDPEVAAVGETPEQARERGADVAVVTGDLADLDRTETYGHDLSGGYGLVADRAASQVLGAWAVGPLASEWIHPMALAISARIPLDLVGDGMAQFPTFAEAWPMAARTLSA
jgi:pyruvate/2-oxoglutarate dehydrogenase complex dihydrolipoamide dehydrogenase (E3) component